jgi:hypothetical protein
MARCMIGHEACLSELRAFVSRADRDDFAAAQQTLLQFILHADGGEQRQKALDGLLTELRRDDHAGACSREQHAFRTVLLAMVERTREMAGSAKG